MFLVYHMISSGEKISDFMPFLSAFMRDTKFEGFLYDFKA